MLARPGTAEALAPAEVIAALAPNPDFSSAGLFGRIGTLETRLARSTAEIDAAQAVRYRVFVEEMHAGVASDHAARGRDVDAWDEVCDHLLVLDRAIKGDTTDQIVGTYRLLRQDVAERGAGFYSQGEFDVNSLIARHPNKRFMELGRSCVLPHYRTKRTLELLWQGNWAYAVKHRIDVMFGCASFHGTDPREHALALSFLHHHLTAQGEWEAHALPDQAVSMDLVALEDIDGRKALSAMPPLIKGYIRLGAKVGHEAVVDHAFGTTDVLIVLPIESISGRYLSYYGGDASRFGAQES
ncbi:hemolysin [Xaviernesmea oryzae]|uniref:L-ornithine N(alpha)-acyltransferase n=2 Tax=Xaviernesmea oryzae TaxID=464029 RepID=A0A1Q9AV39_9HYPH|nr:hemolysin [Xaviernesmea oryzae]